MSSPIEFFTVGYGHWAAPVRWDHLVSALRAARVELLIDIRHSACASQLDPASNYGPRDWHIRTGGAGVDSRLRATGIGYLWLVELGNPQKQDEDMAVLREHLADPAGEWPVHRGLALVELLVCGNEPRRSCMMHSGAYAGCHRELITEALLARLPAGARHADLSSPPTTRQVPPPDRSARA